MYAGVVFDAQLDELLTAHGFEVASREPKRLTYRAATGALTAGVQAVHRREVVRFKLYGNQPYDAVRWSCHMDERLLEVSGKLALSLNLAWSDTEPWFDQFPDLARVFACGAWLEHRGVPRAATAVALAFYELKYVLPNSFGSSGERGVDFLVCGEVAALPGVSPGTRSRLLSMDVDFVQLRQQLEAGVPVSLAIEMFAPGAVQHDSV
jgi:hypothetical protein